MRVALRAKHLTPLLARRAAPRAAAHAGAMSAPQARGAFVVFEGADRAGKSTQCELAVRQLQSRGVSAELWRFPDRTTTLGAAIDAYLKGTKNLSDQAVHLLFSANRWEKSAQLEEALARGVTVVCDRYAFSGVAYTAAKGVPGLDLRWCKAPDEGLPAPDAIVFLDLSEEAAAARGGYGEERYERPEFQRRVLAQFHAMRAAGWTVLDAGRSAEAVHADVMRAVDAAVARAAAGAAVGRLWEGEAGAG